MNINRRGLLVGLGSALAAPAIVHAGNLMPVKTMENFSIQDAYWNGGGWYVGFNIRADYRWVPTLHDAFRIAENDEWIWANGPFTEMSPGPLTIQMKR
jgi:hypothetical protein